MALLSGGMLHMAQVREGSSPDWEEPLLLSGLLAADVDALVKRVQTRAVQRVLIGLEATYAHVREEKLRWQREQPNTPMSISEMRAISRELGILGRERSRRERSGMSGYQYVETQVFAMQIDGRRVLHPVGFSGATLEIAATHIYAAHDVAQVIARIAEAGSRKKTVRSFALDWAARSLLLAKGVVLPAMMVQELSTAIIPKVSQRHVLGVGEESFAQYLARNVSELSAQDIAGFLYNYRDESRHHRELMASVQPALRRWARATEEAMLADGTFAHDALVPMLFPWRVPSVFRYATRPDIRGHLFRQLPNIRWQLLSLPEVLSSPRTTRHDAYAELLLTLDEADPYMMNRT